MKSLLEVLTLSTDFLKKKGISNPRRQAEELLCDALGLTRIDLYAQFERPVTENELSVCRERIVRRGQGEPCQYIHGSTEFYNCHIKVNRNVLIPRQETELLVDRVAKELSQLDLNGKVLWDICCGSGCMGIALKKKFPQLTMVLSDISKAALEIAKENTLLNQVEVELREGNLFDPFKGEKTNFLVCNPPYISQAEYDQLDKEVRQYEPVQALLGGKTGLEFYERLASQLKEHLEVDGMAWFEIGHQQGPALKKLFGDNIVVEKDYAGHDRFLRVT